MSRRAARDEPDAAAPSGSAPPPPVFSHSAPMDAAVSFGELRERCLRGDAAAWRALLERFAPLIYSVGRSCGLASMDCDDLLQSVSLTLYTHLHEIREPDRLPGWLRQTTMRAALRIRKNVRQREKREAATETADDLAVESQPAPAVFQQQAEDASLLHEAVQQLNERCRKLLSALFLEPTEASYQEIAERLGIPVGGIGPTRQRCINQLRDALLKIGFEGSGPHE